MYVTYEVLQEADKEFDRRTRYGCGFIEATYNEFLDVLGEAGEGTDLVSSNMESRATWRLVFDIGRNKLEVKIWNVLWSDKDEKDLHDVDRWFLSSNQATLSLYDRNDLRKDGPEWNPVKTLILALLGKEQ